MKKIRLDLDRLAVETFDVEPEHLSARSGTIAAHGSNTEAGDYTCGDYCADSNPKHSCLNDNSVCVCYPGYSWNGTCDAGCTPGWSVQIC